MNKNMGWADRIVRMLLVITVIILFIADQVSGIGAVILGFLAVVFIITSFVGKCPLYALFGLSTKSKDAEPVSK